VPELRRARRVGQRWRAGKTLEEIKAQRRGEAESAAAALGAAIEFLDAGDYPLRETDELVDRIVGVYREVNPSVVLTHTLADPYNGDHPAAGQMALRARVLAQAIGYPAPGEPIGAPPVFLFEPHQPEMCGFKPEVLLDITPVFDAKRKAMECMGAQQHLWEYYTDLARRRGTQLRRNAGPNLGLPSNTYGRGLHASVPARHRQAELMSTVIVTGVARADLEMVDQLAELGVATVHEAIGRAGYLGPGLRPSSTDENRRDRGHRAVLARRQPHDPRGGGAVPGRGPAGGHDASPSTDGFFGELLATSLAARGVRGLVIEAGVRDRGRARGDELPVWSAAVSAQGTVKETAGAVNVPCPSAGRSSGRATRSSPTTTAWCACRGRTSARPRGGAGPGGQGEQSRKAWPTASSASICTVLRAKLAARGVRYVSAGTRTADGRGWCALHADARRHVEGGLLPRRGTCPADPAARR
jgi:4-oxalomesaconate hydratase